MLHILQVGIFWIFFGIMAIGGIVGMSVGLAGAAVVVAGSQDPGSNHWIKVGFVMMVVGAGGTFLLNPY